MGDLEKAENVVEEDGRGVGEIEGGHVLSGRWARPRGGGLDADGVVAEVMSSVEARCTVSAGVAGVVPVLPPARAGEKGPEGRQFPPGAGAPPPHLPGPAPTRTT